MKALLLVAHGSRRSASNEEVRELVANLTESAGETFAIVEPAFLELAEPDIPAGVRRCVARGATELTVVPYFLAAGTHVAHDIPAIIEGLRDEFPGLTIDIAPHVGASALMTTLIKECALP